MIANEIASEEVKLLWHVNKTLLKVSLKSERGLYVEATSCKKASRQIKIELSFIFIMYRRRRLNFTSNRKIKNKITSCLFNPL